MVERKFSVLCLLTAILFGLVAVGTSVPVAAQEKKPFRNDTITQVDIGDIKGGRYAMKATITTVEPGARIPFHLHKYNGLRYMLEGSLSIQWQHGDLQTYAAGSTYFEGPGANHPEGLMAASNPGGTVARVLIIELVPLE